MNTCLCLNGYFDNGVSACVACDYTCATCSTSSTHCLTCPSASITFRTDNSASNYCPCSNGYYDDGTLVCKKCHYSCLTCSAGTNITCLTCPSAGTYFRTDNIGK